MLSRAVATAHHVPTTSPLFQFLPANTLLNSYCESVCIAHSVHGDTRCAHLFEAVDDEAMCFHDRPDLCGECAE